MINIGFLYYYDCVLSLCMSVGIYLFEKFSNCASIYCCRIYCRSNVCILIKLYWSGIWPIGWGDISRLVYNGIYRLKCHIHIAILFTVQRTSQRTNRLVSSLCHFHANEVDIPFLVLKKNVIKLEVCICVAHKRYHLLHHAVGINEWVEQGQSRNQKKVKI